MPPGSTPDPPPDRDEDRDGHDGDDGPRSSSSEPDGVPEANDSLAHQVARLREKLNLRELQLEQTEAVLWQMSLLLSKVSLPVMLLDPSGTITDLSEEAERMLQRRRADLLGHSLLELLPAGRAAAAREALAACAAGQTVHDATGKLWGPSRSLRSSRTKLFPLHDQVGNLVGMALAEDVGELRASGNLLETVNRELRELALIDGLTQLANRRHFDRMYEREIHRAVRSGEPLAVAMIDVDSFKAYNDSLGHQAGDVCLKRIGTALAGCLRRPADFVARYGGEEFVALMPNTPFEGALTTGEAMRRAVEALKIPHPAELPTGPFVTISVGIACAHIRRATPHVGLRQAADDAMYAAKHGGRNRVRAVKLETGGGEQRAAAT